MALSRFWKRCLDVSKSFRDFYYCWFYMMSYFSSKCIRLYSWETDAIILLLILATITTVIWRFVNGTKTKERNRKGKNVSEIIEQEMKKKKKATQRSPPNICEKWVVHDGMNKAWGSFTEKKHWVKEVPHVSHQGALWAQEPWLLLGMAWEWMGEKEREDRAGVFATERLPTPRIFSLLYPCTPPRQWNCRWLPFAAKLRKRREKQEQVELFPVWASVLWVECDLGTKDKRQKQRRCWLWVLQSM